MGSLAKNWFWSLLGNFIGSLLLVGIVVGTGVMAGAVAPTKVAMMKTSLPWMQVSS